MSKYRKTMRKKTVVECPKCNSNLLIGVSDIEYTGNDFRPTCVCSFCKCRMFLSKKVMKRLE